MLKLMLYVKYLLQVRHSQRANDTPLVTWVICEDDGVIESAHCPWRGLLTCGSSIILSGISISSKQNLYTDRMHTYIVIAKKIKVEK